MTFLKNKQQTEKCRAGYTLIETLIVVGIVLVLAMVVLLSLITIRKQLRQRELDSKAEIIYMAAQNRIAELRTSGYENTYQFGDGTNGVLQLGYIPCDADTDTTLQEDTLCYVASEDRDTESKTAFVLLPVSSVDEELRENTWRIEFDPVSGSVYGVFYSETGELPDAQESDDYRFRKYRLRQGALVGYYGGDVTVVVSDDELIPEIRITNTEKLTATFYCTAPTTSGTVTFTIDLSDGQGGTYRKTVSGGELTRVNRYLYKYEWVLDSLESNATRFKSQTGGKLACGTELTVKLTTSCEDDRIDRSEVSATTNSLFAGLSKTDAHTALIGYGRHLQNLDEASGVSAAITGAVQVADISFADDTANDKDWYSYYHTKYCYAGGFYPITNKNLQSYDGCYAAEGTPRYSTIYALEISEKTNCKDLGLFATFREGGTIQNVALSGTRVGTKTDSTTSVGALVGRVSGNLVVDNCRVYLNEQKGDLTGLTEASDPANVAPWLQGGTVGGLIGTVDGGVVEIRNSFAASVLRANANAGGLVGKAGSSVGIVGSYADCYLRGQTTGGLVGGVAGRAAVRLENFYAAGYQTATGVAAGLVAGRVDSAKNGYAAFDYTESDSVTIYTTATAGTVDKVYYLTGFNMTAQKLAGTVAKEYTQLSGKDMLTLLGDAFTLSSGSATYPYNLLKQGLTTYTYPRLQTLDHYGDWPAEFESGSLVYYETYDDGSFGFSGGNADTLKSERVAVGDGYAIAYTEKPTESVSVRMNDGAEVQISVEDAQEVTDSQGKTYYVIKLPNAYVNPDDASLQDSFYQSIKINDKQYFYNPYFGRTVVANDSRPDAPTTVHIRSARQLYALSRLYSTYAQETADSLFRQELDIDYNTYDWATYAEGNAYGSSQKPITGDSGFLAEYDGGCHTIRGASFNDRSSNIGLFGEIAESSLVHDVVLLADGGTVSFGRQIASGYTNSVNMGALAGSNRGTIRNCAVSGYTMTHYGYNYSTLYLGGLVGVNHGSIRNCEANTPAVSIAANRSTAYVGGFTGGNTGGSITASYALGEITVKDAQSNATVWIAGFVADNANGLTRRCYSATALTASNSAESYGFAHTGGTVYDCSYLDGGTYAYAEGFYAYNASQNANAANAAGQAITGERLEKGLNGFADAAQSLEHDLTGTIDDAYPYPAVVRNASGQVVHYGDWPIQKDLGALGLFYWEYESGGSNSGYHFSYVGTYNGDVISTGDGILTGKSLCKEHNDGGVITEYGYGYFYRTADAFIPTLSYENCVIPAGCENTKAGESLGAQMTDYTFIAYNTASNGDKVSTKGDSAKASDGIYLIGESANATWTLNSGSRTYTYSVSPFFANAISLDKIGDDATGLAKPGSSSGKSYEIRSVRQLQFINWNYGYQTAREAITSSNVNEYTGSSWRRVYRRNQYTYLVYSDKDSPASSIKDLYWKQSHDMNATREFSGTFNYQPIGCLYETESDGNSSDSYPYLELFTSSFDGQAYIIKNIHISSTQQSIGLFGMTAAAELKNVVMYSDGGSRIVHEKDSKSWYTIGGLVGFAARGNTALNNSLTGSTRSGTISNCSVSGYEIIDYQENEPGWGGGIVGGLVGSTNLNIAKCTAANDIILSISGKYVTTGYKNLRVGGLAGVARATISNCYAGGSIRSTVKVDYQYTDSHAGSGASIWASGIAGGIVLRCTGSLGDLIGGVNIPLIVNNCYSYVDLPASGGNDLVAASQSIASNGELQSKAFTLAADGLTDTNTQINNCYALASRVADTDDYKHYTALDETIAGINLNYRVTRGSATSRNSYSGRNIYLNNDDDRSPYLTYTDMSEGTLQTYLGSAFSTVTTTEFGERIDGKYSYPGSDAALNGLNYPFPTVLKQTDAFGNTVNVHYGEWPKAGLLWQAETASLDLLIDQDADGNGALDWKLYDYSGTGGTPTITIRKEGGEETETNAVTAVCEQDAGATAAYTVHFTATECGTYVVTAELGNYTATLHLIVTARITIEATTPPAMHVGDRTTLQITLKNANDEPFDPASSSLKWTTVVEYDDSLDSQPVVCDTVRKATGSEAGTGKYTLQVEGFAEGAATVKIQCTYGKDDTTLAGASAFVNTTTYADVLGLTNGTDSAEIAAGSFSTAKQITYEEPFALSLYLRTGEHTGTCVTMDSFAVTGTVDGTAAGVTLDGVRKSGDESGPQIVLTRDAAVTDASAYSISVTGVESWQTLSLTLALQDRDDGMYTLTVVPIEEPEPEIEETDPTDPTDTTGETDPTETTDATETTGATGQSDPTETTGAAEATNAENAADATNAPAANEPHAGESTEATRATDETATTDATNPTGDTPAGSPAE